MKKKIVTILLLFILLFYSIYTVLNPNLEVSCTGIYTVKNGDTLWSISSKYIDNTVDIRDYINLIYKFNDGLTPNINEGQIIIIPILK